MSAAGWRPAARRLGRAVGTVATLVALVALGLAAWRSELRDPAPTVLLRDRSGAFLGEIGGTEDGVGYWPVERLPERVVAATLALEDRRFRSHPGVDPLAVGRAVRQNLAAGEVVSGASTVAMQLARMQDPGPRTLWRKGVEALTAVLLTARHGRDAVLAQYLRYAPYGNGIHGIAYAARRYLDKPVEDLSWAETAFLCALPQAPSRTNPFRAEGRVRAVARAERILEVLEGEGLLTAEERAAAADELARLRIPEKGTRPAEAMHAVLQLEETARAERGALGERPLVVASLDLALQRRVQARLAEAVGRWEAQGAGNAAAVVVDVATGEVRAAVGSTGYFDPRHAGAIDYGRVRRNPGSTLKPFVYALALDRGVVTPATVLDDLGRGRDGVENADGAFLGPLLPRQALANSRNVPAVELAARLGVGEVHAALRELGLHDDAVPADHYGLGIALGGLPVTLQDLAAAYLALAGDGRARALSWRAGEEGAVGERVVSPEAARQIALFLSDPQARLPSFPRMGALEYPFPVAVKTGTSSDYRDAWTVAFSTRWLVAVWVGDPGNVPMQRLSGFAAAAEIARATMVDLHGAEADGLADLSFPPPAGRTPVRLCPLTGRRAGEACDRVVTEWLASDEAPPDACGAHVRRMIDSRDGSLATMRTPARRRREVVFVDLPARYAAWQARAGLSRSPRGGPPLGDEEPEVRILSPVDGQLVARDVEVPADQATLALTATVEPAVAQLVWYVDGEPFAVVDPPYTARWPVRPGEHRFEARVPYVPGGSGAVRIVAR